MNYGLYGDRKPGDRIADQSGRSGLVTDIRSPMTGHDAVAVQWDDGGTAMKYVRAQQLVLLAKSTAAGKIPRPKLAEMLRKRGI